ncbi:gamma-aminobutyric acid receptor subunit epsilon-like [Lytechinus pictus]|uniref:gamma-aminobutyric acid receptor subunit epsilon-like n=1 Tax=Lytechinus pictus TaxID=7653 RepID=UPI00240DC6B3|nr:gamma-aminobutyric acid receptor subunit epsilon-like isoform X1 [Lytechinus pictus]
MDLYSVSPRRQNDQRRNSLPQPFVLRTNVGGRARLRSPPRMLSTSALKSTGDCGLACQELFRVWRSFKMSGDQSAEKLDNMLTSMDKIQTTLKQIEVNGRPGDSEEYYPPRSDKQKVFARIRCNVITVGDIDTVTQQFTSEIYLSVTWKEPNVKGKQREEVNWDEQWDPRIYFFNAVNIDKMQTNHYIIPNEDDDPSGSPDVRLSIRMKGTFKCSMQLKDFPFDCQDLTIKLMSDWPVEDVEFVKDMNIKDSIRLDTFTAGQQWKLWKHVLAQPIEEDKALTGAHRSYPIYHITTHVQRKPGFYIWNIALIMLLIVILTFTSFVVERGAPADRLSVTVTLLLTAVAFKYVVSQSLPLISYLTMLDKYVLSCLIFQCLVVGQNALSAVVEINDPDKEKDWAKWFDFISIIVLAGMVFNITVGFIISSLIRQNKTTKKMKKITAGYLEKCEQINQNWQTRQRNREASRKSKEEREIPPTEKAVQAGAAAKGLSWKRASKEVGNNGKSNVEMQGIKTEASLKPESSSHPSGSASSQQTTATFAV